MSQIPSGVVTTPPNRNSYSQILKSSVLIGGSSVINIGVGVVRAKSMALLLGPAGVGLVGLYNSILNLTHSIAGMGINQSGVRQIAEAAGSGDTHRMARTAAVLRHTSMVLGIFGAVLLVAFRHRVAAWTFGSEQNAWPVAVLAIAVFVSSISDGQGALLQGMRRIADMAHINVISAVTGSVLTIVMVFFFADKGIVPSLVGAAVVTLLISWWYRRRIDVPHTPISIADVRAETSALLALGAAFMASNALTTGAAYAIRIIVRERLGLTSAGLYQSAWVLGGLYVAFILQAMGSDFYPRLTAVANDHTECNRLVNEQAHISLLLAGPGVVGTLTFAPVVIALFYHTTFTGAVQPLRWVCLGMALRVIAWPMGYIIVAKGARGLLVWTEVAATVVHVGLAYILIKPFGLAGATMAFFGLYIWHGLLVYAIVHRQTGFSWSTSNRRTAMVLLPLIGVIFVAFLALPTWAATVLGVLGTVLASAYSLRMLCHLVPIDGMPRIVREILEWSRLSAPARQVAGLERGA